MTVLHVRALMRCGREERLWTEWPTEAPVGSRIGGSAPIIEGCNDAGLPVAIVAADVIALEVVDKAAALPAEGDAARAVGCPALNMAQLSASERKAVVARAHGSGLEIWRVHPVGHRATIDVLVAPGTFDDEWSGGDFVEGIAPDGADFTMRRSEIGSRRKLWPKEVS